MIFSQTPLTGNYLIEPDKKEDERGFFSRYFCEKEFSKKGLNTKWVQINNSLSKKVGILRGLHFQTSPHEEVKLVRCIKGIIWDVVVDLRKGSKTYGEWFGAELSDENRITMYVPEGFAHGFISLTANAEIIYLVSKSYAPQAERVLNWNDPDIKIDWPLSPSLLSEKDNKGLSFKEITIL
jgi:dTDP-4-dehydrorhamnose 3,5-epimerase